MQYFMFLLFNRIIYFSIFYQKENNNNKMRAANSAIGPTHVRLTPKGSRRIRVYRNGDAHFKGITVVLNLRQVPNIDALLDMVSEKIGLVMGCKQLFTLDGTPVKSMEQLEHNTEYVAASGPFTPVRYGRVGATSLHGSASLLTRSSSNFSGASREDPLAQSGASKQSAPASLTPGAAAHVPLRHSRSIEPRRMVGRLPPHTQMNGPTSRTAAEERSKKIGDKKTRDGSKKRKASKKKDEQPSSDHPSVESAVSPEAQENAENANGEKRNGHNREEDEGEAATAVEEEEKEEQQELAPRTRTEVEVVEHDEEELERQQEEANHEEEGDQEGFANGEKTPESARSERTPTAQTEDEDGVGNDGHKTKENGQGDKGHHSTMADGEEK